MCFIQFHHCYYTRVHNSWDLFPALGNYGTSRTDRCHIAHQIKASDHRNYTVFSATCQVHAISDTRVLTFKIKKKYWSYYSTMPLQILYRNIGKFVLAAWCSHCLDEQVLWMMHVLWRVILLLLLSYEISTPSEVDPLLWCLYWYVYLTLL